MTAKYYGCFPYFLALIVCELPITLVESGGFASITYFIAQLNLNDGGYHYWYFFLMCFLFALAVNSFARAFAVAMPDPNAANG